jgi:hypothetical protein
LENRTVFSATYSTKRLKHKELGSTTIATVTNHTRNEDKTLQSNYEVSYRAVEDPVRNGISNKTVVEINSKNVSNRDTFSVRHRDPNVEVSTTIMGSVSFNSVPKRRGKFIVNHRLTKLPKEIIDTAKSTVTHRTVKVPSFYLGQLRSKFIASHYSATNKTYFQVKHNQVVQIRDSDINGRIDILYRGDESLDSLIVVRHNIEEDLESSIISQQSDKSEISSTITVRQKTDDDIDGKINIISPYDDIDGKIAYDQSASINVIANSRSYLSSSIGVNFNTKLKNEINIIGYEENDLLSTIDARYRGNDEFSLSVRINSPYSNVEGKIAWDIPAKINVMAVDKSQLVSRLGIRLGTRLENSIEIDGYDESDLKSSIQVKETDNIIGEIRVRPYNRLFGVVDIQPPEILTDTYLPVIDSYIRSGVPKLNYGDTTMLASGYGAGRNEIFRSLLRFDISPYVTLPEGFELENAKLKLHYAIKPPTSNITLVMAESNEWTEDGVTWSNAPSTGMEVTTGFTLNEKDKSIEIDISEFISNRGMYGVFDGFVNFYIKNTDESKEVNYFYSREFVGYEPELIINYLDTRISSQGRGNLESQVFVYIRGNRNLPSKLDVKGYWDSSDIDGSILVTPSGWRHENTESSIVVTTATREGSVSVRQLVDFDMPSTIAVRWTDFWEMTDGSITVTQPSLPMEVYVLNRLDMPSTLTKRVTEWNDIIGFIYVIPYIDFPGSLDVYYFGTIDSSITVRQLSSLDVDTSLVVSIPNIEGKIYVRPYVSLDSIISVRQQYEYTIPSTITISSPNVESAIYVTPYVDFPIKLKVRRAEKELLASSISVSAGDRQGSIYVIPYIDFPMSITVRRTEELDIPTILRISIDKLVSSIYVKPYLDINGTIAVRRSDKNQIDTTLRVSNPDLPSRIQPIIHSDLESSISIRRSEEDDLDSNIIIPFSKDLPIRFTIVGASKLPSSIFARSPYLSGIIKVPAYGDSEINGKITIRRDADYELSGSIYIVKISSLDSSITVRRSVDEDLSSTITIRRNGKHDLKGKIKVFQKKDLDGNIQVRQVGKDYTISKVYVLNRSDIKGRIKVGGWDLMYGELLVVLPAYDDLPGSIIPRIRWADDMDTTLDVTYRGTYDMVSELQISPVNKMTGIIDIVPPKETTDVFYAIRDAYVRSGTPRLNYGFAQVVSAGFDAKKNEILRSFLGFDFNGFPTGQTILKAELKIQYTEPPNNQLLLDDTDEIWTEYGITWANQPKSKDNIKSEYTLNDGEQTLVFDVTDYLINKYDGHDRILDFVLRVVDEKLADYDTFFSKESGEQVAPRLEITYFPTEIPSFGNANIESFIDVRFRGNKEIKSKILVKKIPASKDLSSSIIIDDRAFVDRTSRIRVNRPDLNLTITARQKLHNDLNSIIAVTDYSVIDVDGTITITKPDLPMTIYVRPYESLTSSISVRRTAESDIFSYGIIHRKSMLGTITVKEVEDLDSTISVRRSVDIDTPSVLRISNPAINGTIHPIIHSDLSSTITIGKQVNLDLVSDVAVSRGSLISSIFVGFRLDIPSSIGIPTNDFDEIKSYIQISSPDVVSSIYVPGHNDINSRIKVRNESYREIPIKFTISNPDLPSSFKVPYSYDMDSSFSVRVWEEHEMPSVLRISNPQIEVSFEVLERYDIPSEIGVRVWKDWEIDSILRVNTPDLLSSIDAKIVDDLDSVIAVRRDELFELDGSLTVSSPDMLGIIFIRGYDLLDSTVSVRRTVDEGGIPSEIVVSCPDLVSVIFVRGYDSLDSSISTRRTVDEGGIPSEFKISCPDLPSSITINGYYLIPSTITVVVASETDIITSMTISQPDLVGTIGVWNIGGASLPSILGISEFLDTSGTISIRVWDEYDLPSTITIRRGGFTDIDSSISVRVDDEFLMPSVLRISNPEFDGTLTIKPYSLIFSKIMVIISRRDNLPSRMAVRLKTVLENDIEIIGYGESDIPSTIGITPTNDLESSILVVYRGDYDKESTLAVRNTENHNMPSSVFIYSIGESYLLGQIGVRPVNKMTGKVFIIPVDDSDLPSSINIHEILDINSEITVRQTDLSEIPSSIIAKQVSDLPSSIFTRSISQIPSTITVHEIRELPSSIDVWEKSLLDSKIYILYNNNIDCWIDVTSTRCYSFIM